LEEGYSMTDHAPSKTAIRPDADDQTHSKPTPATARGKRSRLSATSRWEDSSSSASDSAEGAHESPEKALIQTGTPWLVALRKLLGVQATGVNSVHFAWGFRTERLASADLRILAQRLDRDVIFLEFEENRLDGPPGILVAVRNKNSVILHEDCELWVLKAWQNVEIMTAERRFKVDDVGRLKSKPNNLDEMRARRVALTHARWKALAAEMAAQGPFEARIIPKELFAPIRDEVG